MSFEQYANQKAAAQYAGIRAATDILLGLAMLAVFLAEWKPDLAANNTGWMFKLLYILAGLALLVRASTWRTGGPNDSNDTRDVR
ncbi:MAG TPA: hypothetical protein VLX92_28025 [Kofleriaceae bacterium]|nr:hypothetical protein [Kofleriaceae bacterium]